MSHRSTFIPALWVFVAGMLCLLVAAWPGAALAQTDTPAYVPGEVLIGWSPDGGVVPASDRPADRLDDDRTRPDWQRAVQTLAALTGVQVLDAQPEYGTARLAVQPGNERAEIARLRKLPWVRYAEPNYIAWATALPNVAPQGDAAYPNDPGFGNQWHMRRIGAPEAWGVTFGSTIFVVAVIDSGVDLAIIPSSSVQFQDPFLPGWDYVNGDSNPNDDYGHGTHVTGVLAAAANNGLGVAGLAPNVKILPLKVLDSAGRGDYSNIALAIRRAADRGAQSHQPEPGGMRSSASTYRMRWIMRWADNVLVVAAAGNCAQGASGCTASIPPSIPQAIRASWPWLPAITTTIGRRTRVTNPISDWPRPAGPPMMRFGARCVAAVTVSCGEPPWPHRWSPARLRWSGRWRRS